MVCDLCRLEIFEKTQLKKGKKGNNFLGFKKLKLKINVHGTQYSVEVKVDGYNGYYFPFNRKIQSSCGKILYQPL